MENIFQKGNYRVSGTKLLKELLKLRPQKCECCGNTTWLEQPIKLEVHHIDGDCTNNILENLSLLCPNCHSYTDSWCKNKPKVQVTDEQLIKALQTSKSIHQALLKVGLSTAGVNYDKAKNIIQKYNVELYVPESGNYTEKYIKYYCPDCGIEITKGAIRCRECANKAQYTVQRPSREELKQMIRTISFEQLGRNFGVDGNAIRKWCDAYKLPRRKCDIKQYSDEEWSLI